jgi:hypothetical protein
MKNAKHKIILILISVVSVLSIIVAITNEKEETLVDKIVANIEEHPSDWIKIDEQSDYDALKKTDTILAKSVANPISIIGDGGVNDVYLIGDIFYNKKCNLAISVSNSYYTYIRVISKSQVVELNREETDDVLEVIQEMNENIRMKKQQEILNEVCK